MVYVSDVCCEECKNYEDISGVYCAGCIHSDYLINNYEPASPELMAKREAKREAMLRKQFLDLIPKDEVVFELKTEFKEAFEKAWTFVPDYSLERFQFFFVSCFDSFIMATDTHRLIKIWTSVPNELIGKDVIFDKDEGKFFIRRKIGNQAIDCAPVFDNGQVQEFLDQAERGEVIKNYKACLPIEDGKKQEDEETPIYVLFNKNIAINKVWVEELLAMFTDLEEITVHFKGPLDAVKFSNSDDIEALILPMRVEL
ncbi:hypothetical protein [Desulfosporosinus youngiae]|uniref:Uncharacterized protein n=1 Tax=Desulfosporosinus youngiae DSM 17734 TaxID=768710 RepID=H5Y251_9FIRM|nr:hypothetical protein [Desulfosporosinus youngiae]EHQ88249.1 hypothetical protein DesyoDRAFT_1078 [Desulfosporosinus youngiae DSM 17734]